MSFSGSRRVSGNRVGRSGAANGAALPGRILLLLITALVSRGSAASLQPADRETVLAAGQTVERQLLADEVHSYHAELPAGSWLLNVEQRGIDVVVAVTGADGAASAAVDSPVDRYGPESLLLEPDTVTSYHIEVRSRTATERGGRYRIEITDASGWEHERLAAERALSEAGEHYLQDTAEARQEALTDYQRAFGLWRSLGITSQEARSLFCIAGLRRIAGQHREAIEAYLQVLPLWRSLDDREKEASTLNSLGLSYWTLGELEPARNHLGEALELHRSRGDRFAEAATLNNLCLTHHSKGELDIALGCYNEVLALAREIKEVEREAVVLTNIGTVYRSLAEPRQALDHYQQALTLARSAADRKMEARTLNNLGVLYREVDDRQRALECYDRALQVFQQLGDRRWEARTLSNIGRAYLSLGDPRRAQSYLQQALALGRELGESRTATLSILGRVYSMLGENDKALSCFEEVLSSRRQEDDKRLLAIALSMVGEGYLTTGKLSEAYQYLSEAVELLQTLGDRRNQGAAIRWLGYVHLQRGEPDKARERLQQALQLNRQLRQHSEEAGTLYALARAEHDLGDGAAARSLVQQAITILESLPVGLSDPELRASSFGTNHQVYELAIELQMEAHRDEPSAGHDRKALAMSEQARARTLLDLLYESGAEVFQGVDPELQRRRRDLLQRLNAKAARQLRLLGAAHDEDEARAVELEVFQALTDLETLDAEIRRRNPHLAALTEPSLLSVSEAQGLLDAETVLLEYALGEQQSYLWLVTSSSIASFELPSRREIEELARRAYQQLSTLDIRAQPSQEEAAATLAGILLAPVAEQLEGRRIAVVADGALSLLPFGALPIPSVGGSQAERRRYRPIMTEHEVVYLPSASSLALQRRELHTRPLATKAVAVLADPVFARSDARVGGQELSSENLMASLRTAAPPFAFGFDRLPSTRREAEAIVGLVPREEAMLALDFQASRTTALSDELRHYRIIHFATHGLLNAESPALSGLVLSLVDERGRDQDGFLRLHDVYGLQLGAELVVLSGCRTALGKEVRGEGLLGITRGFMYAGVPQVVSSLWQVPDRVTTTLMSTFYAGVLVRGLSPAEALTEAQRAMLQERIWRDPYYWAAFVLQGDWRSRLSPDQSAEGTGRVLQRRWDSSDTGDSVGTEGDGRRSGRGKGQMPQPREEEQQYGSVRVRGKMEGQPRGALPSWHDHRDSPGWDGELQAQHH